MKKIILIVFVLFTTIVNASENRKLQVDVLAKSTKSWNGAQLPVYPKGQPEVTILRIKIPTGMKLPIHKHPVINAGVLISGELTVVTLDNREFHLKAGDSIVEMVETWHYGINNGDDDADIIVVYAGVVDKPITVKR